MSVSPSVHAVICEEIFDESSHPSVEEINEYASKIGIDPQSEPHLLHLAKEGLMQALPPDWKPCYDEKSKSYYYYNSQTGRTQWEHPLDDIYRSLVTKVRSGSQTSFEEDSKALEDQTYTKEDLQSYEESLSSKPLSLAPVSPHNKLDPINLGAKKKEIKLSPVKIKSKSMDFGEKRRNGDEKHPNLIEKGELTLSGAGSVYLKANTKKIDLPKSILRDRSLPEDLEDDKKSVRFNTHIEFNFSDSQKQLEEEVEKNLEIAIKNSRFTVSKVILDEYAPISKQSEEEENQISNISLVEELSKTLDINQDDEVITESIFEKIEIAQKLEENISPRNSNLKLIKPNPTDFLNLITDKSEETETVETDLTKYKKELEEENEKEIENLKQSLLAKKEQEIENKKTELEELLIKEKQMEEEKFEKQIEKLKESLEEKYKQLLEDEEQKYELKLNERRMEIENKFREKEKEIESNFQMSLKQTETDFILKLEERIKEINLAHKTVLDRMKDDHELTLAELIRDFKSEEEIIRKEQNQNLESLRDKITQELELEKQKMRELGEDRLYEKVRCEKRLLEDKYRCLKEKYVRLKTDVKVSLERRNRRKEQSLTTTTTTGSDTEKSTSHKKGSNAERVHHVNSNTPKHLTKQSSKKTDLSNKPLHQIIISDVESQSDRPACDHDLDSSDAISTHGRTRRKMFTRLKSNSTSRLNNNPSIAATGAVNGKNGKELKRACSPVENLRRQLQKLEDLEDQFPQTGGDTYHLRYPFSDAVAGDIPGSSELEFFRHRIHLERDSVRRAKETLRLQRTNFQKRQRDLKLRHNTIGSIPPTRAILHQLFQEERELSDMEVSLHRTRSLLGEKVIRLRHLEQSLQRLSANKQEDASLSDLSSHSASSGISSTEFATATDNHLVGGKSGLCREEQLQESSEIMQSLENLNSEIREIWDVLNKQQHTANITTMISPMPLVYSDQIWPMSPTNVPLPTLNAIPTLADRLHDYHQQQRAAIASHGVQSIVVSQTPRAAQGAAVTTTLVERTKNLRDWLRNAKVDQQEIAHPGQATL